MLAVFRSARRKSMRSTAASFALAIALTGGVAVASTAIAPATAHAQEENSAAFSEAYGPIAAMVQADVADFEGARAGVPGLIAAIETNADRDLAGNLMLNIGSNLNDRALQLRGLILRLESGRVAPEQQGLFNWFAGNLSFELGNYDDARRYLQASHALGHRPEGSDPVLLIASTYLEQDAPAQSVAYLLEQIAAAEAAGQPLPEQWLLNALQTSYDHNLTAEAVNVGELVVTNYPSQSNWSNTLQIVSQLHEFNQSERVDLYRLMLAASVLNERRDVSRFIDDLDPRVRPNEVERVLAHALANNVYTESDGYYTNVRSVSQARSQEDRNSLASIVSDGISGDGLDAINAGDILYSLEDYTRATSAYQTAMDKGFDRNTALTRLGIAMFMSGDRETALSTLVQVDGNREPIARMWIAYINAQAN